MNIEEERKRFEAWISKRYEDEIGRYPDDPEAYTYPGSYKRHFVQVAWLAWQEAIGGER